MRKFLAAAVAALSFAVLVPSTAKAFSGGDGSETYPYRIASCDELQSVGDSAGLYYALANDIDCGATSTWNSGAGFVPFENFTGHFDGRNFTISSLYIYQPSTDRVGLFRGVYSSGTVKNLNLSDAHITGKDNVGGLFGQISTGGNVNDVAVASSSVTGNNFVGGVVGSMLGSSGAVRASSGAEVRGANSVGGIAGYIVNLSGSPILTDVYSVASVSGFSTVGGVIGDSNGGTLSRSYAAGTVRITANDGYNWGGGLLGQTTSNAGHTMSHSFSVATISGGTGVGGLFGTYYSSGFHAESDLIWDVTASGVVACSGQVVGEAPNCTAVNADGNDPDHFKNTQAVAPYTFGWDFTTVWQQTSGYPTLRAPILSDLAPLGSPSAPGALQIQQTNWGISDLSVSSAGSDYHGSTIDSYELSYRLSGSSDWTIYEDDLTAGSSKTISTALTYAAYDFRLRAHNALGWSDYTQASYTLRIAPTQVWVSGDYSEGSADGHIFGYDAYNLPSEGVSGVASGGTVHVMPGVYVDNMSINQPVSLIGPGVISLSEDDPDIQAIINGDGSPPIFINSPATGVTVSGFVLDEQCSMDSCSPVLGFYGGAESTVRGNEMRNASRGIGLGSPDADRLADDNLIEGNDIHDVMVGVLDGGGSRNIIHGNTIHNTGNDCGNDCVPVAAVVIRGARYGIAADNQIINNIIRDNENIGIYIEGNGSTALNTTITGNLIYNNGLPGDYDASAGITLKANSTTISGNVITNNSSFGIRVGAGGNFGSNTLIEGNTIGSAHLSGQAYPGNSSEGIRIEGGSDISITNNQIMDNGNIATGIRITGEGSGTGNSAHYNNISRNGSYGILNTNASSFDASNNFWGSPAGPGVDGNNVALSDVGCGGPCGDITTTPFATTNSPQINGASLPTNLITGRIFEYDGTDETSTDFIDVNGDVTLTVGGSNVEISDGTHITATDGGTINTASISATSPSLGGLSGFSSGVVAKGAFQWGIQSLGLTFDPAITLHIDVGADLAGQTLNILRSTTGTGDWTSDGIVAPATCTVTSGGICTFQATHASTYAPVILPVSTSTPTPPGAVVLGPWLNTASTPMPTPSAPSSGSLSQHNLREGDTVSAPGSSDPDVYIVNVYGFKRLFLNPVIFDFYGHLGGFSKVKSITAVIRDLFPTSGLFRNCETNAQAVYAVEVTGEDTGILHHVVLTGDQALAQDPDFFKKVFCINTNEFNWYTKGSDYTSLSQVPVYSRK